MSDTPQRRQAMVLSDPGPRGGAFTTPGYYVVDRFAVAQDGPFGTPSEALANLAGRDGIQFLDQPVTPSTVEEFPPSLRQSLGSRKAPMSLTRTAAELRSAELDLMQRMASSAPAETAAMMPELEAIRREAQRSNEETYDWEATRRPAWSVSHTAATSETQSSSKSDWLLDIPLPGHVAATTIVAAANLWFESVPALVRGHWGEYAMQAHSAAKTEMGRRHADTDSYRVFMDTAERLHKVAVRREGTDSLLPWSAVVPPLPPTMVGPNSAPDMNQVPQEPGNTGQPLPLPGMAVADDEFGYEPSVDEMAQASAPGNANTGTVADMGFQDMSLEPNRNPAVAARRVTADAGEDSDSDDEDDNESQAGGYSPFSDPLSSYNNPGKGPHDGTPFGGIPLRGPLTPEQQAWMDKGRRKRTGSAAFSYPRQSYEQYLAAISEGAVPIPRELWSGMAAAIAPVGPSAQRMASRRTEAKGKGLCQWHECRNNGTQVFDTGSGRVNVCADHAENVIDQESKRPSLTAAQRTAAAKPVRHNDVRVKIVKRLQNSTNGNPRFDLELHHPDGDITRHRTMSDASASYDVENVHNSGEPVDVELTPKGNVRSIYTKKDKNRTAAAHLATGKYDGMEPRQRGQRLLTESRNPDNGVNAGNNTKVYPYVEAGGDTPNGFGVHLHGNRIVVHHGNGDVTLNSGGYHSATTASRMNEWLPGGMNVRRKDGLLHVLHEGNEYPLEDGARFTTHHSDLSHTAAMRVASQDELGDAIDAHARSERGTIKVGDQIGPHTITDVGTHTIQHVTPNGWSGSRQIPFIDGATGQSLPSHRRALEEIEGGHPDDWMRTAARNPTTREVHYSEDLHDQAREVHPQAANWWGVRGTGSSKRAQCYICDKDIDSWAGGYPMTKRAQQAVRDHAAVHEGDGQHTAAAKPGQVNYSDPTGANVGRNQSPGAGDWGNTLPEAGDNFSNLTDFPDTGPTYLPSTRSESPETTDYQGYQPNDAPQPVSGQYQASLRRTAAGDHEGLDDAVEGYKRAALWTTPHEDPEGSDHNGYLEDTHSTGDFHPDSHAAISHDVNRFLHENDADARHAADKRGWDGVGHDIWLDRNQHGTGAWDRGLGKAGDRLSEAGRKMGEDSVYKGDDNLIHSEREGRTTPYTARRRPMRTAGLYLAADDDDEPKPSMKARSPQGWINDGNADSPDAASSQLLVDWTGDHDPVSYLGVPPVQGYEYSSDHPNGEMFPWSAGPVGSAPTGAAAVWGVPTPGAANLAQEGSSYPQPR